MIHFANLHSLRQGSSTILGLCVKITIYYPCRGQMLAKYSSTLEIAVQYGAAVGKVKVEN